MHFMLTLLKSVFSQLKLKVRPILIYMRSLPFPSKLEKLHFENVKNQ